MEFLKQELGQIKEQCEHWLQQEAAGPKDPEPWIKQAESLPPPVFGVPLREKTPSPPRETITVEDPHLIGKRDLYQVKDHPHYQSTTSNLYHHRKHSWHQSTVPPQ